MPVPATNGLQRNALLDLQIGDYIPCHYTALTSGQAGYFHKLGDPTGTEIPVAGTATPNGKFNWVCVERKQRHGGLCIADRVVQHSVSYDNLHANKLIEGLIQTFGGIQCRIRSLTGGVAYMGADGQPKTNNQGLGAFPENEWDKCIVNSDLGGKIIAGDNAVWNWSNTWAWVKDVPIIGHVASDGSTVGTASYRMMRSGTLPMYAKSIPSTLTSVYGGFRPVLEFRESGNIWGV